MLLKDRYRVVVMGAAKVGKTSLVSRFLYDQFQSRYHPTVEELHEGCFDINGALTVLEILDTSGSYEFPAMRRLAIATGDAFVLVYSVDDEDSFAHVNALRKQILEQRGGSNRAPIVVVCNKTDLAPERRVILQQTTESTVTIEWELGYAETSCKDNVNVDGVFRELFLQSLLLSGDSTSQVVLARRGSFPYQSMSSRRRGHTRWKIVCPIQ